MMQRLLFENRWAMVLGIMFAMLMQPAAPLIKHFYQTQSPVVDMHGELVEKSADAVVVHITGTKLRVCAFMRVTAYTSIGDGTMREAYLTKLGMPIDGSTKPIGTHDIGLWQIRPVAGSTRASVFVQHDCSGEVVLTKIVDIDLTK